MTFRHYGGSTPKVDAEWTCPSCQAENTVPLKAGCQSCGAGADARKVGEPAGVAGALPGSPATSAQVVHTPAPFAEQAFWEWLEPQTMDSSHAKVAQEAFMAGVAWAQGQTGGHTSPTATVMAQMVGEVADSDLPSLVSDLYLSHPYDGVPQMVDQPTLQTILAALAFYRDNVLGYGVVPGQLAADQVTDLIARLNPPVEEP